MHGLATGDEARQQLETMMTRARLGNDVYLVTGSDGDPHRLIRPETIHPQTASDILDDILSRDGSSKSATTMAREAAAPASQLRQGVTRYTHALYDELVSAVAEHGLDGAPDRPALESCFAR